MQRIDGYSVLCRQGNHYTIANARRITVKGFITASIGVPSRLPKRQRAHYQRHRAAPSSLSKLS